jgi:hypothetical protein
MDMPLVGFLNFTGASGDATPEDVVDGLLEQVRSLP